LRRGVFLDRDGTVNVDLGYASSFDALEFLPGAAEGLRLLGKAEFCLAVITHQSGVARGYHTEEDVRAFNAEMNARLAGQGATIDRFHYCPHHVDGVVRRYCRRCDCRKPGDALYRQAVADLDIDPKTSFAIGDKPTDLEPAVALGATGVLICDPSAQPESPVEGRPFPAGPEPPCGGTTLAGNRLEWPQPHCAPTRSLSDYCPGSSITGWQPAGHLSDSGPAARLLRASRCMTWRWGRQGC